MMDPELQVEEAKAFPVEAVAPAPTAKGGIKKRWMVAGAVFLIVVSIAFGAALGVGLKSDESTTAKESESNQAGVGEQPGAEDTSNEEQPPNEVSFVGVGCYQAELSLDVHPLDSISSKGRAYECSKVCITRFFGVADDLCSCFVDVPQARLAIGSCELLENASDVKVMELYFNENTTKECSQDRTKTVRNFLVEEDDAPFGFDIVSNSFRSSPFELFKDECGTNVYEVQTEVSEGSQSLQTSMFEVKAYARSRRSERVSSLTASASISYSSFLFSASAEVSASSDSELVNVFESSGASEDQARVFTSVGVKRLAEVKILDFDNTDRFLTLSRQFGNLIRAYWKSDYDKQKAYEIIAKYGQFVMTRGIFGGYMQLRTTMKGHDVDALFSSEQSAKD